MILIPKKTTAVMRQNRLAIGCVFHGNDLLVVSDLKDPPRILIRADTRPLPPNLNGVAIPPRLAVFFL
jgi:hypothetical protein